MSGLVVQGVTVKAGERTILDGAGFTAPAGAVTGLIGPNGAGKSTMIGAVMGLRRLVRGTIAFDGANLPAMLPAERARLCAHVEQFATTTERLTVGDVVGLGRVPFQSAWQAAPSAQDETAVASALAAMGMATFANRLYQLLSGGEQQRVQIARALAQEPRMLLLDEPTSHLDIKAQLLVLDVLRAQAQAGCTVLLAMHDLNLAARYCDHLVVLDAGKVVAEGTPADVLDPDLLLRVYGVAATIVQVPGKPYPLVIYDSAPNTD
ncbi:MAG: iron transporter ATP-binding protein [Devosia sp.]|uniref:ABC transporter ATP-binding protein n=1 Tax=Devosia sp. TaxID=1871048 RepID=UPI002621A240|nr:ABC transporter ATP-binding protein [Devosia sp.]MDB5587692.1 iron transporter ATP-binding protein [Devosia sp.]